MIEALLWITYALGIVIGLYPLAERIAHHDNSEYFDVDIEDWVMGFLLSFLALFLWPVIAVVLIGVSVSYRFWRGHWPSIPIAHEKDSERSY